LSRPRRVLDRLWAPWRIAYIKRAKKEKGCLFCRVFKSRRDAQNLLVLRSKLSLALLNRYPYNTGHLMAAPVRHAKSLELLSRAELLDLMLMVNRAKRLLDRVMRPQGYNIGINVGRAAGAGIVGHLHVHIVPRWIGDVNCMPSIAGTKVISQSLEELYRELSARA